MILEVLPSCIPREVADVDTASGLPDTVRAVDRVRCGVRAISQVILHVHNSLRPRSRRLLPKRN